VIECIEFIVLVIRNYSGLLLTVANAGIPNIRREFSTSSATISSSKRIFVGLNISRITEVGPLGTQKFLPLTASAVINSRLCGCLAISAVWYTS
jgi:hypothetical protein